MMLERFWALPHYVLYPILGVGGLFAFSVVLLALLTVFFTILFVIETGLRVAGFAAEMTVGHAGGRTAAAILGVPKFALMMLKSLRRNLLRTSLTFLASFVLVLVITGIWTILAFVTEITSEKKKDLKAIVTERFQVPSLMKLSYAPELSSVAQEHGAAARDLMTWTFVISELEKGQRTPEKMLFTFSTRPATVLTMFEGLEESSLPPAEWRQLVKDVQTMKDNIKGILVGPEKLKTINKKVGDRIKAYPINYKNVEFEYEIVGVFPPGRYDQNCVMNQEYFERTLDSLTDQKTAEEYRARALNLFWMRLPDQNKFEEVAGAVGAPGLFSAPAVKVETASTAFGTFLDAFQTIFWAARYLLSPAILATLSLVIANAISIGVRERRTEMAVLKVLGFQPWQILILVLGESLLVGVLSGVVSSWSAYFIINYLGGIKFPLGFFPAFPVPADALWWGPTIGGVTAFLGTILPAWSARTVKVSDVFSKVS